MDEDDALTIGHDDAISVERDPHTGELVVRVMRETYMEPARWLRFDMVEGRARRFKINEIISALQQVRDQSS